MQGGESQQKQQHQRCRDTEVSQVSQVGHERIGSFFLSLLNLSCRVDRACCEQDTSPESRSMSLDSRTISMLDAQVHLVPAGWQVGNLNMEWRRAMARL